MLARIRRFANRDIQRVGLSATVGNPSEMLDWLSSDSARGKQVIRPEPTARGRPEVQLDYVGSLPNAAKIIRLLRQGQKRLVFCDSRSRVEQLSLLLRQEGVDTFVSHSSLGLDERRRAERAFAQRQNCAIVATSSLELGLDVGDLDRVLQIDAPPSVSSFLQRMGRTGRRTGTTSNCLILATTDESLLRAAALLDLWQEGFVEPVVAPPKPFHILAQQLMALVLQERGVGRSQWFDWVATVPGFAEMDRQAVLGLVEFMLSSGILWTDNGLLFFAPEGEAKYGRKNFMELLSVFTSPPLFRVVAGRKELGFVHESTFYKRDEGGADHRPRRSELEDEPSRLEAPDRPRRARRGAGAFSVAGGGTVPELPGMPEHSASPRVRRQPADLVAAGERPNHRDPYGIPVGVR